MPPVDRAAGVAAAAGGVVAEVLNSATRGAVRAKPARRSRPFPLALWAHLTDCCHAAQQGPAALLRYTEAFAGVATLALGLQLAPQVAAVEYGSGCRIHRIRVVNSATPGSGSQGSWATVAVADTVK